MVIVDTRQLDIILDVMTTKDENDAMKMVIQCMQIAS